MQKCYDTHIHLILGSIQNILIFYHFLIQFYYAKKILPFDNFEMDISQLMCVCLSNYTTLICIHSFLSCNIHNQNYIQKGMCQLSDI